MKKSTKILGSLFTVAVIAGSSLTVFAGVPAGADTRTYFQGGRQKAIGITSYQKASEVSVSTVGHGDFGTEIDFCSRYTACQAVVTTTDPRGFTSATSEHKITAIENGHYVYYSSNTAAY